jgi:hypothetical protein
MRARTRTPFLQKTLTIYPPPPPPLSMTITILLKNATPSFCYPNTYQNASGIAHCERCALLVVVVVHGWRANEATRGGGGGERGGMHTPHCREGHTLGKKKAGHARKKGGGARTRMRMRRGGARGFCFSCFLDLPDGWPGAKTDCQRR